MSDSNFLARWSRRKLAAERPADAEPVVSGEEAPVEANRGRDRAAERPPPDAAPKPSEDFDLASLPPIESITATSDVTAFLRRGVPEELTRAALRRAWTSDPAIRDFVGLSENAWDFNDPDAMAGFGRLDHSPEQVRQLVSDMFGEARPAVEKLADAIDDGHGALPTAGDSKVKLSQPPHEPEAAAEPNTDAAAEPRSAATHNNVNLPAPQQDKKS